MKKIFLCDCPADKSSQIKESEVLAEICDKEFLRIFETPNIADHAKRNKSTVLIPFVCVTIDWIGPDEFYILHVNEDDLDANKLDHLVQSIKDQRKEHGEETKDDLLCGLSVL